MKPLQWSLITVSHTFFFHWSPASFTAQNVPALVMSKGYVAKEAFARSTVGHFVAEVERCVVNVAGDCTKRKVVC